MIYILYYGKKYLNTYGKNRFIELLRFLHFFDVLCQKWPNFVTVLLVIDSTKSDTLTCIKFLISSSFGAEKIRVKYCVGWWLQPTWKISYSAFLRHIWVIIYARCISDESVSKNKSIYGINLRGWLDFKCVGGFKNYEIYELVIYKSYYIQNAYQMEAYRKINRYME